MQYKYVLESIAVNMTTYEFRFKCFYTCTYNQLYKLTLQLLLALIW